MVRGPRVGDNLPGDPGSVVSSAGLDGDDITPVFACHLTKFSNTVTASTRPREQDKNYRHQPLPSWAFFFGNPSQNESSAVSVSHWLALGHIPVTIKSFDPGGVIAHPTWALRARRKAE